MIPLSVPEEDRRIVLRSFWFLISAVSGLIAGVASSLIHLPGWLIGPGVFVIAASFAFTREQLVRRLYHAWNSRVIRPLSGLMTSIILRVCLFLVFAGTGRAGSRLQLAGLNQTMWLGRDANRNRTTQVPFVGGNNGSGTSRGWLRNYLRWAFQSHNAWAISLVPFLWMLRMVSTEEPAAAGGNIYTLF